MCNNGCPETSGNNGCPEITDVQPPLPLNGNLRNTSYMKQIPNMNFSNISFV